MKKIFFTLCAVAALASCTNNEVVNLDKEAISFGGAFVDNATKAADNDDFDGFTITSDNITYSGGGTFDVWANTKHGSNIVPILEKEAVTYKNDAWGYAEASTQYWIPGNTYNFVAVKNGTVTELVNGLPETITYNWHFNAANYLYEQDLIYAEVKNVVGQTSGNNNPVSFSFNHLLSKVYFTVDLTEMSQANENYAYMIPSVYFTNVSESGSYKVSTDTWTVTEYGDDFNFYFRVHRAPGDSRDERLLSAGDKYVSDMARLVVPAVFDLDAATTAPALRISGFLETFYGDEMINSEDFNIDIAQTFERGHVYNFVLKLGNPGEEIQFTVQDVTSWDSDHNGNGVADDDIKHNL